MSQARILIVDDEPKLIHLVREILQATGYEVFASSSGNPALEMVAMEQPDLIHGRLFVCLIVLGQRVSNRPCTAHRGKSLV